jgi:hypothetical protein
MNNGTYGDTRENPLAGYTDGLVKNYTNNKWVFYNPVRENGGFVLTPGLAFDPSILGPFIGYGNEGFPDGYVNGAITIQAANYDNNLITSSRRPSMQNLSGSGQPDTPFDVKPTLTEDGSYVGGYTTGSRPEQPYFVPDAQESELFLFHAIIDGVNPRTILSNSSGYRYANGDLLRAAPGVTPTNAFTIEALVKLASLEAGTGQSALQLYIQVSSDETSDLFTGPNDLAFPLFQIDASYRVPGVLDYNGTPLDLPPEDQPQPAWDLSKTYQHVAWAISRDGYKSIYVNGQLWFEEFLFAPEEVKPWKIWTFEIRLADYDVLHFSDIHSPYPGRSQLKAFRFTPSNIYKGETFNPPSSLTSIATLSIPQKLGIK